MSKYEIIPLPVIKLKLDMGMYTYLMNYGIKMWAPVLMWYIKGGETPILVDSGAEFRFAVEFRDGPPGDVMEVMPFEEALSTVGLHPDEIGLVIQTHLHWDHCGNTHKCKSARVVVQNEELKFAFSRHPLMEKFYEVALLKNLKFEVIDGPCTILPGIDLVPVPGHTPGCQAVCVQTEQGNAVISGFCAINENFFIPEELQANRPVITPGIHVNALEAFESSLKVKELADIVIPQHDPSFCDIKVIP